MTASSSSVLSCRRRRKSSNFTACYNAVALYLDDNSLSGDIPETLSILTGMVDLRLGGNEYSGGAIPDFIFDFTDLQILRLHDGNFTGPVPGTISSLTGLRQLWLQDNALTGAVPDVSAASELVILRLTDNEFTGSIPTYLESLPALVDLRLGDNALTGAIPDFSNMAQLQLFACQGNQLTGGFPESLTNLVNLSELSLMLVEFLYVPQRVLTCALLLSQWFSTLARIRLVALSRRALETWQPLVSMVMLASECASCRVG